MKRSGYIIVAGIMLTVTAVSCSGNPSVKPTSPTVSITITDNQGHGVVIPWAWGPNPSCLAIMGEAMQAMDMYLPDTAYEWPLLTVDVNGDITLRHQDQRFSGVLESQLYGLQDAYRLWRQAKARCWRK